MKSNYDSNALVSESLDVRETVPEVQCIDDVETNVIPALNSVVLDDIQIKSDLDQLQETVTNHNDDDDVLARSIFEKNQVPYSETSYSQSNHSSEVKDSESVDNEIFMVTEATEQESTTLVTQNNEESIYNSELNMVDTKQFLKLNIDNNNSHNEIYHLQTDDVDKLAVIESVNNESVISLNSVPLKSTICLNESNESLRVVTIDSSNKLMNSDISKLNLEKLNKISIDKLECIRNTSHIRNEIYCLETKLEDSNNQVLNLELEQQRLAGLEEFEMADTLTEKIENLQNDIKICSIRLRNLLDQRARVDDYRMNLLELGEVQIVSLEEVIQNLDTIQNMNENLLEENKVSQSVEQSVEESRLRSEMERLDLEKTHAVQEKLALLEHQKDIELTIELQTKEILQQKVDIGMKHDIILQEIIDLENLLILKKTQEKQLRDDLIDIENGINNIRSKFQRQLQRIDDQQHQIAIAMESCAIEEENLNKLWMSHREEIEVAEKRQQALKDVQTVIDTHKRTLFQIKDTLLQNNERMLISSTSLVLQPSIADVIINTDNEEKREEENDTTVEVNDETEIKNNIETSKDFQNNNELFTNLTNIEMLLEEANAEHTKLTLSETQLSTELRIIIETLSKLDSSKKSLAASKQFKEAAIVAKEEKNILSRKSEIEEQLINIATNRESQAEILNGLEVKRTEILADLRDKIRMIDANYYHINRNNLIYLQELRRKIESSYDKEDLLSSEGNELYLNYSHAVIGLEKSILKLVDLEIEVLQIEVSDIEREQPLLRQSDV